MVPLYTPASCSPITPVFCLPHLISFCHLCTRLFFPSFFPPCSGAFIGALHSTRHVSLPHFHPSLCHSLNPLSFALLGPHPSRFSFCSPEAVSACCPISTYSSLFPLFFLIHFLSAISSIHPPPFCLCKIHHHPSLPQAFLTSSYTFPTIIPLTSVVFLHGFKFTCLSLSLL